MTRPNEPQAGDLQGSSPSHLRSDSLHNDWPGLVRDIGILDNNQLAYWPEGHLSFQDPGHEQSSWPGFFIRVGP